MEQVWNVPIRVLSVCDTDGRIEPLRLRLEDTVHRLHTVLVRRILSVKEVQYVGLDALVYVCQAEMEGRERLLELRYAVHTHRWVLLRTLN